jgi:hypothetical protein
MEFQTNHGDKQMDKGNDTVVGAILEQLIEHGSGDIASVFARACEPAMRIERAFPERGITSARPGVGAMPAAAQRPRSKPVFPGNTTCTTRIPAASGFWPGRGSGIESRKAFHALHLPKSRPNLSIPGHCRDAWNKLVAQPDRIASVGGRTWAQGV